MEKFIYDYLNENYYISTSKVGNDGIYLKDDTRLYVIPFNGKKLLENLQTIFSISEEDLRTYVNFWAHKQKKNVNLVFYWTNHYLTYEGVLPLIEGVSRVMSTQVIPIQPMTPPSTTPLLYLDYVYQKESNGQKIIRYFSNIYNWIFGISKK